MDNKNTTAEKTAIIPDMKVSQLLKDYPELEKTLLSLSPAFAKLKNPVLRRTVAKVTSLRQAAKVANLKLSTMINALRQEAGLSTLNDLTENDMSISTQPPEWFSRSAVTVSFDAREKIENGESPLEDVMKKLNVLSSGEILELTTSFIPAPLIDAAGKKNYTCWTQKKEDDLFKSYFIQL